MSTGTAVDFEAIKAKQRAGWETGDYPRVGNTLQIIAELLVEAADVRAGQAVLDIACGQGNVAMAAARRFADATGVDYAVNLLAQGRERAAAEHLPVTFLEGDAEKLPVPDAAFDLVASTVGVMFAPNHQQAADELVRVTKPGGKIALASWTPEGMIGDLFRTVGKWAPPPAGVQPPTLWGKEEHLRELFGDRVEWVGLTKRSYVFRYHSPEHFSEWFRQYYGPITRLAGTLPDEELVAFAAALAEVPRGLGLLSADRGDHAGATEWLSQAASRSAREPDRYQWVHAHVLDAASTAALARDDDARARPLVAQLATLAARCDMRELMVRAKLHQARLGDSTATASARLLGAGVDNPALKELLGG